MLLGPRAWDRELAGQEVAAVATGLVQVVEMEPAAGIMHLQACTSSRADVWVHACRAMGLFMQHAGKG